MGVLFWLTECLPVFWCAWEIMRGHNNNIKTVFLCHNSLKKKEKGIARNVNTSDPSDLSNEIFVPGVVFFCWRLCPYSQKFQWRESPQRWTLEQGGLVLKCGTKKILACQAPPCSTAANQQMRRFKSQTLRESPCSQATILAKGKPHLMVFCIPPFV